MRWLIPLLLLVAGPSAAQSAFKDYWYAGVNSGVVIPDDDYDFGDGTFQSVRLGRTLGETQAVEVSVFRDELDFGIDYGLEHQGIELNYLQINREPLWDPYFLVGVGWIRFDAPLGEELQGSDLMLNVGIGGHWELLPGRLYLNADLRLRYDFTQVEQPGQEGFGDGVFSLGLTIPFQGF